jgi:hypothetical protein
LVPFLILGLSAPAQSGWGTITGAITDPGGAVVFNAPIQARNTQTRTVYKATTSAAGMYTLSRLPAGTYDILVPAVGFTLDKLERKDVVIEPGQTLRLTLLMHPGGKCHLTSGILPRKSLQLSRDWIHDGPAAIVPSARIGPVLIDTDKVRLPLIASFGTDQLWTRRDGNFAWKNDPILAATQTALLPDAPATVEEGYVRIAPANGGENT